MKAEEIRHLSIEKQYDKIKNLIYQHMESSTVGSFFITYDGKIIPEVKQSLIQDGFVIKQEKDMYIVSWWGDEKTETNDIPIRYDKV